MYLYAASSPTLLPLGYVKLGCTRGPHARLSAYLTGCPPGLDPSHDIYYLCLFETTAETQDDLFDCEDELHDNFHAIRMMRIRPGDSEWFRFTETDPLVLVRNFVERRAWYKRTLQLADIPNPQLPSSGLCKQYRKNLKFIKQFAKRCTILNSLQTPVINAIHAFTFESPADAGYVIAPCGSGKTIMTCKGVHGIKRLVVVCPSQQIQTQWHDTLIATGVFPHGTIKLIGASGTTAISAEMFTPEIYCIITTNMSSHLLAAVLPADLPLLVIDEAHHMAGIVAKEETGEGRTRRLMMRAKELGIKRLSLTYTPRLVQPSVGLQLTYISMDDDAIFGPKLEELKIRDLINNGVLPDYRLWMLRDNARAGNGLTAKAECLLEAWAATEVVHRKEQFILHHMVVFAATIKEATELEKIFAARTTNTLVQRVEAGMDLSGPLQRYTEAPRAILVNCFVLGEGVDIPITNAVALTYPKQSRGQITQMVLRAGRWYEGKSLFHVLIPTIDGEDLTAFEDVLAALASSDDQLRDEIILRATKPPPKPSAGGGGGSTYDGGEAPECIMLDQYEAREEDIRRCFDNIRRFFFSTRDSHRTQALCIEKGIDTSIEYTLLRETLPDIPADPRPRNTTWYDYLHPTVSATRDPAQWVRDILEPNNLRIGYRYDEWRALQPTDVISRLPSVQHITDGYFGADMTEFNLILDKFTQQRSGRGRGR